MNANDWNERARLLIGRAVRAPSSHNTQPWYFRLSAPAIDLCADRTRALPVSDPDDREMLISCGAALLHLRIPPERRTPRGEVVLHLLAQQAAALAPHELLRPPARLAVIEVERLAGTG